MELIFTEKDLLESNIAEIIGVADLKERMLSGKKLKVKLGIDPTSPNIHLGRSIPVWRLRAFQELGHEIHLIIGDFTGQIGDTSDKTSERPMLEEATIQENLRTYIDQLWLILNPDKKDQVFFHYNSEWLSKLTLGQISQLADAFSVNSFVKRELIARRLEEGSRVSLREMLYPLMQGYDSIAIDADVELGGTDQRFNLLAGRTLQEKQGKPQQAIIMNQLINGTDGRKMSSSWGNVITLLDTPGDKFGKVMSIPDELIGEYLSVLPLSVRPFSEEEVGEQMKNGVNPRDLKLQLAKAIVALYHGQELAEQMADEFTAQFSEHQLPADIPTVELDGKSLLDVMEEAGLVSSRSEGRRLLEQRGVKVNEETCEDAGLILKSGDLLQVGKRRYLRIG